MKAFCLLGASALREPDLVCELIASFRIDGWSVSSIKRAPDGFEFDRTGKRSYAMREAGCSEVMLVGDRRLVLMEEFRDAGEPSVESLLGRLAPVDVVIVEGFKSAALPAVEVWLRSAGRASASPQHPHVFAVVCDEPLDTSIPCFAPRDVAELARHIAAHLGLAR